MKIEYLTAELFEKFEGVPPPVTLKGLAMTDEDDVLGIVAISIVEGERYIMCSLKPGAKKRSMIEGWKKFTEMMDEEKTYYALIDGGLDGAPDFLKHFGFEPLVNDIYIFRG